MTFFLSQIIAALNSYGITKFVHVAHMEDPQNEGHNRGFCFVEFSSRSSALNAFERLQQPDAVFGTEKSARVAWAEPLTEPDAEIMAQVSSCCEA